jgi:hypothetical protein
MAWRDWSKSNKVLVILVLLFAATVALFVTGVLQKLLADAARERLGTINKKYVNEKRLASDDIDYNHKLQAGWPWSKEYMQYVSDLGKKDPGKTLLWAATMYSMCLMGDKASDLRFEYLYYNGMTNPNSAEAWFDIMNWEDGQDNSQEIVSAMGYAFYHVFYTEHKAMTGVPHRDFEKFKPRVDKLILGKSQLAPIPTLNEQGEYDLGELDAPGSKASEMLRNYQAYLAGRHEKLEEWGIGRWFDINCRPW